MPYHTSSYTFVTRGTQRTFHHLWHLNGQIYECSACGSACHRSQAYSKHWRQEQQQRQPSVLSAARRRQLDIIATARVECFMLCNEAVGGDTQQFLLDAGINAVPAFLRFMFHGARRLDVRVAFYVRLPAADGGIHSEELLCQSSELAVRHHCDVAESVDMLFAMLLEKIGAYANLATLRAPDRRPNVLQHFEVKRLRLNVRRSSDAQLAMALPLQYRLKRAAAAGELTATTSSHSIFGQRSATERLYMDAVAVAYKRQQTDESVRLPRGVNLFCFRTCPISKELYTVPYHLENAADFLDTPSAVVIDGVAGEFERLVQVTDVRRFLREDPATRVLECSRCRARFVRRTQLALHKRLLCGREFEILKMAADCIEVYENCLSLKCADYDWALYGILR